VDSWRRRPSGEDEKWSFPFVDDFTYRIVRLLLVGQSSLFGFFDICVRLWKSATALPGRNYVRHSTPTLVAMSISQTDPMCVALLVSPALPEMSN
jgi:hypothetical protein